MKLLRSCWSLALIGLLVSSGCWSRGPARPDTGPGREVPAHTEEGRGDHLAALGGVAVERAEAGPWLVRRVGYASGGDEDKDCRREAEMACRAVAPCEAPAAARCDEPSAGRPVGDGQQAGPLRAGASDDNADLAAFASWLDEQFQGGARSGAAPIAVRGMRSLRVRDPEGRPLPAARVTVLDEAADRVVWRATTYGDGAAPYYPGVAGVAEGTPLLVEVRCGDVTQRAAWDGRADLEVRLERAPDRAEALQLDVCFVIDTTGSMSDEIGRIQESLLAVTTKLRSLGQEFDLRYGAVLYRDIGDEYLTQAHPFTGDIAAFDVALRGIAADGGGDGPESLNQGLAVAVDGLEWREGAAKVAFLITDAPPHLDYPGDVAYPDSLRAAVARGIRIHSVAASGLDPDGSIVLRQAAQFTRGKFVFIEYGGEVAASAASHGVEGPVASNNLDAILFEQLRDEVARWGRVGS